MYLLSDLGRNELRSIAKFSAVQDAVFFSTFLFFFKCEREGSCIGEQGVKEGAVLLCDSELNDKAMGQIFFIGAFASGIVLPLFPLTKEVGAESASSFSTS